MKTTLFSTVGAIALSGLAFTLAPSTLSAKDHRGSGKGSSGGHGGKSSSHCGPSSSRHCSTGRSHGSSRHCSTGRDYGSSRHCSRLPRGCRSTSYRGERCWYGGGNYYRCAPQGGYVICEQPEVEYQEPIVRRRVVESYVEEPTYVEEPAYEEEEVVSYLPEQCSTVYVGGERCWYSGGQYYRHCGKGYKKFHCDRGSSRHCSSRESRSSHCSSRPSHCSSRPSRGSHCSSRTSSSHNSSHGSSGGSHKGSGGSHKGGSSHGRR